MDRLKLFDVHEMSYFNENKLEIKLFYVILLHVTSFL